MVRAAFVAIALIVLIVFGVGARWSIYVYRAHQTFESYYHFRGCQKLIQKTDTYAVCRLPSGVDIKIVRYQNKWYLDGDLPVCYFGQKLCL